MNISTHRGSTSVHFTNSLDSSFFKDISTQSTIIILDPEIRPLFESTFGYSILLQYVHYEIPSSETSKEISYASDFIVSLSASSALPSHIITFGGGALQDFSGFLACLFKRGISWTFIPTTLLAMADSCIGSKISINIMSKKNQIGFFYAPTNIYICPPFLKSLPKREYLSGCGDILHYALQTSNISEVYSKHLANLLRSYDSEILISIIKTTLSIKKVFIEQDEFDSNLRRALNLGHSFGHAIESSSAFKIPHGIAVIIGCALSFNFSSRQVHLIDIDMFSGHSSLINDLLAASYDFFKDVYIDPQVFEVSISSDKKNVSSDYVKLVLPVASSPESYAISCIDYNIEIVSRFFVGHLNSKSFFSLDTLFVS